MPFSQGGCTAAVQFNCNFQCISCIQQICWRSLVIRLEPKMLPVFSSWIFFFFWGGGNFLALAMHMCAGLSILLAAASRLPAVLSHNKHTDPFSSQQCLWAMQSGQVECPQGGPSPIHTELEQLGFGKPAFANWLLVEGQPTLWTSSTSAFSSPETLQLWKVAP